MFLLHNIVAIVEHPETAQNVRTKPKTWILVQTFEDKLSATEFIKNEQIWSHDFRNHTSDGVKVYYRCNTIKSHSVKCPASIHLLYDATSNSVQLFKTNNDHDHSEKCISKKSKVADDVMQRIKSLFEEGKKPKFIRQQLGDEGMNVPTRIKLNNILAILKTAKIGNSSMSLGELEAWLESISK